ncbi:MAG: hypothetical protein LBR25_00665 [Erysipelotrichaceae bacterium]|jgi:hypothetical protein|nr:hypothetical protein [Erysipelotrichaceae bacterium]
MRKKRLIGLVVWMLMLLTSCTPIKAKIKIIATSWNGWPGGGEIEEFEHEYDLNIGDVYKTESGTITILSINKTTIKIKTAHEYGVMESDGSAEVGIIDTEFEIPVNTTLKLVTPTTDAGAIMIISWQLDE